MAWDMKEKNSCSCSFTSEYLLWLGSGREYREWGDSREWGESFESRYSCLCSEEGFSISMKEEITRRRGNIEVIRNTVVVVWEVFMILVSVMGLMGLIVLMIAMVV